jgi:hypothetical protein
MEVKEILNYEKIIVLFFIIPNRRKGAIGSYLDNIFAPSLGTP